VIGDVDDAAHRGDELREHPLDALAQGDVSHTAPLASAAHAQHHDGILHVDELDPPAVARDHGIHLFVEDLRDLLITSVSSLTADGSSEAGLGAAATAGTSAASTARMAFPTALPTACQALATVSPP